MFTRPLVVLALVLSPSLATATALVAQDEDTRPGVAALRFDNGGSHGPEAEAENFDALEVGLQQMLLTELSQNPELRVVERGRVAELTREQGLATEGVVDPETAARIGRIVGARYVVIGSFSDLYGTMRADLRVVDVETSEVLHSAGGQQPREQTLELLIELADRITTAVDLPPLPEAIREEREEKAAAVPSEGISEYSHALMLIDEGFRTEGLESLERVVERFPEWEEPRKVYEEEQSRGSA